MWESFCICITNPLSSSSSSSFFFFFFFFFLGMNLVIWCNFWSEGYGAFAAQLSVICNLIWPSSII
jgi:hypothetical protein